MKFLFVLVFLFSYFSFSEAVMYRVCRRPDSTVRIIKPDLKERRLGETDAEFVARIGDAAIAGDSTLQGLPCDDVDATTIPSRMRTDSQGDAYNARNAFVWDGAGVVIDPAKSPVRWTAFADRVYRILSPNSSAVLEQIFPIMERAVETNDAALIQGIYDRLQASGALSQAEKDAIRMAVREKRIPITP